jgi:hypothetical protein
MADVDWRMREFRRRVTDLSKIEDSHAATILSHTRENQVGSPAKKTTSYLYPKTVEAIETWLDSLINAEKEKEVVAVSKEQEAAVAFTNEDIKGIDPKKLPPVRESSSIHIVFLDEQKWAKELQEDPAMARLEQKLKINDRAIAHYMASFCRFPLPLDIDQDNIHTDVWAWRYTISHPFDWDMVWAYFPSTKTSVGIVRTWFADYRTDFKTLEDLVINFHGPTLANPVVLGVLALQVLTNGTMDNIQEKGNRLYQAQRKTGFHTYNRFRETETVKNPYERPKSQLDFMIRDILGAASNMTGWQNAAQQLKGFAKFIQKENKRFEDSTFVCKDDTPAKRLCGHVEQQAEKLTGDLDGAYHDASAWLATTNFLLQGVLNLLLQHDSGLLKIAEETKRETASMAMISVVAMLFLPGTFTAVRVDLSDAVGSVKPVLTHESLSPYSRCHTSMTSPIRCGCIAQPLFP